MGYYETYREQLTNVGRGHALWSPDPSGLYDRVEVGDVGFVRQGHFLRMFNALLPADHPAHERGVPQGFEPLRPYGPRFIRTLHTTRGFYCSNSVTVHRRIVVSSLAADRWTRTSLRCGNSPGAFLYLPFDGVCHDVLPTKHFETYIRMNCDRWLAFATDHGFGVRLEDIILVTGCDLTASWAMAAFVNPLDTEISLSVQVSDRSARFQWSVTAQPHNNEPTQNDVPSHCVFLRGFRAKRIRPFFRMRLKAAAEPRPDDSDHDPESSIEPVQQPAVLEYRDPLIGVLDFIAEQCPDQEIAIAHEDDLKIIRGVDVLSADAVESFLRRNKIPVRTEHGAALLAGEGEVHEDQRVTFFAQAHASVQAPLTRPGEHAADCLSLKGKPIRHIVHPVLMEYLLKFDIASQPPDYGFGLPAEDLLSSAVHPPVSTLVLEHNQDHPQNIEVQVSDMRSGVVTVEEVLKTVGANLRLPSSYRELSGLTTIHVEKSRPPSRSGREPKTREIAALAV